MEEIQEALTKAQVSNWLQHPVTLRLVKVLQEHKEANEETIKELVVNSQPADLLQKKTNALLIQLKAQVNTLDAVLDLKEFVLTDEEKEKNEIQSIGTEGTSTSQED